jgi:multisubunit Na+/H+ antiporter MnhE subunit
VKHLRGWVIAWVALFWLWLLFSGDWNRIEVIAAACAATVGATLAEVARSAAGVHASVPLKALRPVVRAAVQVFPDFGLLVWALALSVARREIVRGKTMRRAFHAVADDESGARVVALWAANLSPNAIAVDIDRERHESIVHDLIPHRASERPA